MRWMDGQRIFGCMSRVNIVVKVLLLHLPRLPLLAAAAAATLSSIPIKYFYILEIHKRTLYDEK